MSIRLGHFLIGLQLTVDGETGRAASRRER